MTRFLSTPISIIRRVASEFALVYIPNGARKRKDLRGHRCKVIARGSSSNAVLLEFEDGTRLIASQRAVRKVTGTTNAP